MSKLRVAHITAVFPPYWSGTGNVAYYNALELARRGHEVHVFTAQYPLNDYRDPHEIIVHRLWTPFRLGNAPCTPTLLVKLRKFDLIHLHWPYIFGAEITWLASHLSRTPYVMTYHLDLKVNRKWIFGPYQYFWGPTLARDARRVLAVSLDHLKSSQIYSYFKSSPKDIEEVPNGVDIEIFNPSVSGSAIRLQYAIPEDAFVILFVGAMDKAHEYKGVPDLINAFRLLNNSQVWLLLIGSGELLQVYQALAVDTLLHYHTQVIFTGSKAYNQLPGYYSAADICVLPSRQPESFGMVLVEAMACGKPVIASDSPGVRSLVSDGIDGFLVRPGDTKDLTEKIAKMMAMSVKKRATMGAQGRKKAISKYSWEGAGEKLDMIYQQVISENGA